MSAVVHSKVGHESRDEAIPTPGGTKAALRVGEGCGAWGCVAPASLHPSPARQVHKLLAADDVVGKA